MSLIEVEKGTKVYFGSNFLAAEPDSRFVLFWESLDGECIYEICPLAESWQGWAGARELGKSSYPFALVVSVPEDVTDIKVTAVSLIRVPAAEGFYVVRDRDFRVIDKFSAELVNHLAKEGR